MTGSLPQFCRAHCIREVLFLLKPEDAGVRRYGRRLIKQIGLMFETIRRKGEIKESKWKGLMNEHREPIERRVQGRVAEHKDAQRIAKRLREWGEEYFRFREADFEPMNNPAELTIRQTVLDRVVTQGSRGRAGNEWHERFWTVLTTCGIQNISVMKYLKDCLAGFFGFDSFPNDINPAESL
jgi:hypothetical protein